MFPKTIILVYQMSILPNMLPLLWNTIHEPTLPVTNTKFFNV